MVNCCFLPVWLDSATIFGGHNCCQDVKYRKSWEPLKIEPGFLHTKDSKPQWAKFGVTSSVWSDFTSLCCEALAEQM